MNVCLIFIVHQFQQEDWTAELLLSLTSQSSLPIPLSSHFVPTLKAGSTSSTPTPSSTSQSPDVLSSYLLLLRAGFIRQSSSGIFTLLPNAIRILEKIERIVDEEMRGIGASKIQMPTLLSSRLWRKTGRFETMGSEVSSSRWWDWDQWGSLPETLPIDQERGDSVSYIRNW